MRGAFAGLVLDVPRFALRRGDDVVHVEPQVFEVLAHLVAHRDRVVPKEELLDAVWGDRFVSESALTSRIKAARRAVGDDGTAQRVIRTVHGRGYRFVSPVEVLTDEGADAGPGADAGGTRAEHVEQEIRFCTTPDGVRLAYAVAGQGPVLVRAAHWMTHLDYDLTSPVWSHWIADLSARCTLVRDDERGCGLSDHDAVGWGRDDTAYRHFFASSFLPDAERAQWDAFAELQRRTTSAENAYRFMHTYARIDVSELATQLRVPTLVLHARDDRRVPFDEAREPAWAEVVSAGAMNQV